MRDVLEPLLAWWRRGEPVAMGTVVATWDAAPRPAGAAMLVGPDGTAVGSVSGGCVESDVYARAEQVLSGGPPSMHRYGVSDSDAFSVGLTCGGQLDVFVEEVSPKTFPGLDLVAAEVAAGRAVAVATVVEHPDPERVGRRMVIRPEGDGVGSLGSERIEDAVLDDARGLLAAGVSELLTYGPDGERLGTGLGVFVSSLAAPARMLVFGAIDFAAALAQLGTFLGYAVTVCDARPVFATPARFPEGVDVVVDWPHRYLAAEAEAGRVDGRTAVCVLTHDPKFDVPLLEVALRLPELGFVGAMGSRSTCADRAEQLRRTGVSEEQLSRLSSPIGLDLGARTPEETALSIAAEIVGQRWGGQGARLRDLSGRIHHEPPGVGATDG